MQLAVTPILVALTREAVGLVELMLVAVAGNLHPPTPSGANLTSQFFRGRLLAMG